MACEKIIGIYWCLFDWPSFATLATGAGAILGATIVGLKQAAIARRQADVAERQSEILSRQVALETAKLRADLFDRRLKVFSATTNFVAHITDLPDQNKDAQQRLDDFATAFNESRFLFADPRIPARLAEIWEMGNKARFDRAVSVSNHADGVKSDPELNARLQEYPLWSLRTLGELSDVFQSDLAIFYDSAPPSAGHL